MKRIFILIFLLLFSIHSAACGDSNDENNAEPSENGDLDPGDGDDEPGDDEPGDDEPGDDEPGDDEPDLCPEGEIEDPNTGECVTTTPETCAEINATECFSNYDCQDGFRCQDLSGEGMDVCCVPGDRGEGAAGEECGELDGEAFCESAICIGHDDFAARCSTTCESADDCPDSMQMCSPIAFSGSDHDWCFPTE